MSIVPHFSRRSTSLRRLRQQEGRSRQVPYLHTIIGKKIKLKRRPNFEVASISRHKYTGSPFVDYYRYKIQIQRQTKLQSLNVKPTRKHGFPIFCTIVGTKFKLKDQPNCEVARFSQSGHNKGTRAFPISTQL